MSLVPHANAVDPAQYKRLVNKLITPAEEVQLEFAVYFHYDRGYDARQPNWLPRLANESFVSLKSVKRVIRNGKSKQLVAVDWASMPSNTDGSCVIARSSNGSG